MKKFINLKENASRRKRNYPSSSFLLLQTSTMSKLQTSTQCLTHLFYCDRAFETLNFHIYLFDRHMYGNDQRHTSSPILITVQFPLSLNSSFIYFYYMAYLTFFAAVDTRFVLMTSFKNSFPLFYIFGLLTEKKRIRNTKREKKTKRKIVHRFQVVKGLTFLQTSDDNLLFLKKS